MKISQNNKSLIIVVIGTVIIQSFAGCASIQLPETRVQPISNYLLFQEKEGLKIAIDPFFEKERIKNFFGIDLLSEGILPILVVAENHNAKANYFLQKDSFLLETTTGEFISVPKAPDPSKPKESQAGAQIAMGGAIGTLLLAPGLGLALAPIVVPLSAKAHTDAEIIMQNLIKKELMEKSISHGNSQCGFVYFKLQDETAIKNISAVHIKAANLPIGEITTFVFHLIPEERSKHEK